MRPNGRQRNRLLIDNRVQPGALAADMNRQVTRAGLGEGVLNAALQSIVGIKPIEPPARSRCACKYPIGMAGSPAQAHGAVLDRQPICPAVPTHTEAPFTVRIIS